MKKLFLLLLLVPVLLTAQTVTQTGGVITLPSATSLPSSGVVAQTTSVFPTYLIYAFVLSYDVSTQSVKIDSMRIGQGVKTQPIPYNPSSGLSPIFTVELVKGGVVISSQPTWFALKEGVAITGKATKGNPILPAPIVTKSYSLSAFAFTNADEVRVRNSQGQVVASNSLSMFNDPTDLSDVFSSSGGVASTTPNNSPIATVLLNPIVPAPAKQDYSEVMLVLVLLAGVVVIYFAKTKLFK